MSGPQFSNPRKRRRSEQQRLPLNDTAQPPSKRQETSYPSGSPSPPAFWDSLSKIWLTKGALGELNRRNSQRASRPSVSRYRQASRPITRHFLAELTRYRRAPQTAAEFLRHCEPGTLKDIKLFARHGGPDLSDLKGFPAPTDHLDRKMSASQSSFRGKNRGQKRGSASTSGTRPTTNTPYTKTESSGPYSRNFQQKLVDDGVYHDGYEYPNGQIPPEPDNLEDINQRLAQPRPSLSPSQFSNEKFMAFKRADARVTKENKATKRVIPIIEGKTGDEKWVEEEVLFTNLAPLINDTLTAAKPDVYHGARPEQLDRRVRDELSDHIIPSTQRDLSIVPNFFLEAKGPDGSLAVAGRQASYDAALGARAMHSLHSYAEDEPIYDNNAYTITSTYHGGQLKMYTSHLSQPTSPGGRPEYYMTQINTWGMTGNPRTCREGATAYRNATDWAKEQRDEAIARANAKANALFPSTRAVGPSMVSSFASAASLEPYTIESLSQESRTTMDEVARNDALQDSETSMDEPAPVIQLSAKRSSRKRSHQPQRKRRIADESGSTRNGRGSAEICVSHFSSANGT